VNNDSHKIRTYLKIIDYLRDSNRNGYYPTVTDIMDKLDQAWGIEVARRSIQRHLFELKYKFYVKINKQEGKRGGYEIDIDDTTNFKKIYYTLKMLDKASHFREMLENSGDSLQYISIDGAQYSGYQHIEDIIKAINKKRVLKLLHKKFGGKETERKVGPYFLKEYRNRWYLVGKDYTSNEIRSFGLDRVDKIKISDEKFNNSNVWNIKKQFNNHIGIVSTSPPEKVVLKFESNQIGYFRTYPWHHSADIKQNEKGEWIVKMFVSINYELEQLILMNHAFVQVIKPKHLADNIIEMHKAALDKYV